MAKETFEAHAADLEKNIGPLGFKTSRATRVDGEDAISVLEREWGTSEGRARLQGRTPIALDRDRILHSDHFRRQDDKYHVLFSGATRLARTYTSHSIKAAAMARSVAGRLELNSDLAEAIILGSKVGGVPFIHVGKQVLDGWVRERVKSLDEAQQPPDISSARTSRAPALFDAADGENWIFPGWIDGIRSADLRSKVTRFMPWAAGSSSAGAYASGQESYWTLTVNPFDLEPNGNSYLAQTMYGIWRKSPLEWCNSGSPGASLT